VRGTPGTNYLALIKTHLPDVEHETLVEVACAASELTRTDVETCVRRYLVTRAHALGITTEEVFQRVVREQSADFLFPNPFL
jgi:hypothetical protein